jgi:hypothetical protein
MFIAASRETRVSFIETPVGGVRMANIDFMCLVDVNLKKLTEAVDSEVERNGMR